MTNESCIGHDERPKTSSDRMFGLVFAAVFLLAGLFTVVSGGAIRPWAGWTGVAFGGLALAAPRILAPLNRVWTRFGMLLHRIVNPIVLGVIFLVSIMPIGLILRALGKDNLRLRFDPAASSYWIRRNPPGPGSDSFPRQF